MARGTSMKEVARLKVEHTDAIIVGSGLAGVTAALHILDRGKSPNPRNNILETLLLIYFPVDYRWKSNST